MTNLVKKTMNLAMALLMVLGIFASAISVFAEGANFDYKVESKLKVDKNWMGTKTGISGTVDLSKTTNVTPLELVEGNNIYKGSVSGSVEAADLFEGAYRLYKKEFKGKKNIFKRAWENIVMFNEGGNFPTAQYTVKFPSNFHVDKDAITATENTAAVSSIETKYNDIDNSVTITIKLGNWNDYKEFFELVAGEREQYGHKIDINIPFTVDSSGSTSNELGTIVGSGNCFLYKCSGSGQGRIVNIRAKDASYIVLK